MTGTRRRYLDVEDLARHRAEADDRVGSRADIVGSMLGVKMAGGELVDRLGITYFVREKIPLEELRSRDRIPKRLSIGDGYAGTDVIAWPAMVEQSLTFMMFDGAKQGTLTCFGINGPNRVGVSCGHCLLGADQNGATPTPVSIFSNQQQHFVQVGTSINAIFSAGTGHPGSFGYFDCGSFFIGDPAFQQVAHHATPLPAAPDLHPFLGHQVKGVSNLNAVGAPTHDRFATVLGVDVVALGIFSDLALRVNSPGTFGGDSGMLWTSLDGGTAVAIHCRGEVRPAGQGSAITTAMSAFRAANLLGVTLAV